MPITLRRIGRDSLRYGDVIFFLPTSRLGRAIVRTERRKHANARYSHVAIVRKLTSGRVEFLESVIGCGAHQRVLDEERGNVEFYRVIGAAPRRISTILPMLDGSIHYGYSRIIVFLVCAMLGIDAPRAYSRSKVCAEFADAVYGGMLGQTPAEIQQKIV